MVRSMDLQRAAGIARCEPCAHLLYPCLWVGLPDFSKDLFHAFAKRTVLKLERQDIAADIPMFD
jgi:hypothetical protein